MNSSRHRRSDLIHIREIIPATETYRRVRAFYDARVRAQGVEKTSNTNVTSPLRLTPRQRATLRAIKEFAAREKLPPTFNDLQVELLAPSKSTIHSDVKLLAELGLVTKRAGVARSIQLTARGKASC